MSPRYEGQQRRGAASVSVATQRQQAQTVGDIAVRAWTAPAPLQLPIPARAARGDPLAGRY
jgi:hypothetical protein